MDQLWLEVLQLLVPVVVQQPIEGLLVIWPTKERQSYYSLYEVLDLLVGC
jgi:hypothetical protein